MTNSTGIRPNAPKMARPTPQLRWSPLRALFQALVWVLLWALLPLLGACNSQNFSKPAESQNFGQKVTYNNQVDVLFVMDTSGNMSQNQKGLADQIPTLVDAFNQTGLDYQFAVTTMDMSADGEKGRFVFQTGTQPIMNASTPNLGAALAGRLYIGDYDWHPLTRGLESMKNALSGTNASSGPNAGFLRPNAMLVLVFLTAGNDKSTPDDYKGFLDKLRPPLPYGAKSWVAQFMGVTPDDPNCKTSTWGYNEPGTAYIDLANYSGGAVESICDGNFTRALTNVKARVLEMVTEYYLNATVVVSSIKVYVNGQTVTNDATNGWTYNDAHNSIVFHGSAIPAAGATVSVVFDRDGLK